MADTATLQARLAEAETALHALSTGRQVVEVERNGKKLKYTPTDVGGLRAYIAELKRALGLGSRQAIGVNFGVR